MKLIPANEVTIETLAKIMENAFYLYEVDHDILRVKIDNSLFFISLNTENYRYGFQYSFILNSSHPDLFSHMLSLCNKANMETTYLKFSCYQDDDGEHIFAFETDVRYDVGFDPRQFMSNFRFFEYVCNVKLRFFANELKQYI